MTQLKAGIGEKTVYDPIIWSEQRLKKAAIEAFLDSKTHNTISGNRWRGFTKDGFLIEGRMMNQKIRTFYFEL